MRILFYINTLNTGGAERVMANLANQFAKDNDVIFVTSKKTEKEYELSQQVERYVLDKDNVISGRIIQNVNRICNLRRIIKEKKPDIVVSFMAEANFRSIIASIGLSCKTLVSVRNEPRREYAGKLGYIVGKFILPFADGCVFQTEDAKKWFSKRLRNKSRIIFNAVKEDFYATERCIKKGRIVTCGRLEAQKNHIMLIRAIKQLESKEKNYELHIYGDGKLKKEIENEINELRLSKKIKLMGVTKDVCKVLSEADLFVMSSDYEGMPNALLEAMAVGVPVIATDCPCGGPKMILGNNDNGLLVKVGDVEEMAEAIWSLLSDEHKMAEYSERGKKKAMEFFPDEVFEQWNQYIKDIVAM